MKKRNSSGKYIAGLILLIALCVFGAFITTKGITKKKIGRASNIELGLDLAGGVSITYEVDGKNVSDSDMKDTVYKLQKRVEGYSTEAEVYQEGKDRINIEIPGVTDANKILDELGKPGTLSFAVQKQVKVKKNGKTTTQTTLDTVLTGQNVKKAKAVTNQNQTTGKKEYLVALEFDAKGQGKIKISLETGEVVNGIRYGHAVTINTNDEWQKISVPLSEFVNNGNEVPLTDVVGMAFSAAESGNLDNNAEETKMMSADELEEKAVTGCVVIDNITLAEQDTTSPTAAPEATTQPTGISYVADFETADTKFASGKTWGGFKNKSNDYQDYIKAKWLQDGGVDGSTAFCVYYQSATYYAGEIFVPAPAVWTNNGAKGAEYLNFDYKGKGAVKISFSTGNTADGTLTSGTRYTRRFELDSHGDWAKISVPLSEFVNGENAVNMTEIGTVTFQAAENANLDNNSDDTKAMSADELKEIARTGEIIFDNMTLSETEGKTTLFSSVKVTAEIDGKEITNLTNGDIKIKAIASDIEKDTNMVMIVAVYKENGVIDTVRMAEQKIIGDGELMLDLNVTDAEHQTMKVFIFDDFTNLHPIINVTNFL